MTTHSTALAAGLLLVLTGCAAPKPAAPPGQITAEATSERLLTRLVVDKPMAFVGEGFDVRLTAVNTGRDTVAIPATSAAPIIVTVWRYFGGRWERVLEFPRSAIMVYNPWTLAPGEQREFRMTVPVEPDWPLGEVLKLTAELNGRSDARPFVLVRVEPRP